MSVDFDFVEVSSVWPGIPHGQLFTTYNMGGPIGTYKIDDEGRLLDQKGRREFAHGKLFFFGEGEDNIRKWYCAEFDSGVCRSIRPCEKAPDFHEAHYCLTHIPLDWAPQRG